MERKYDDIAAPSDSGIHTQLQQCEASIAAFSHETHTDASSRNVGMVMDLSPRFRRALTLYQSGQSDGAQQICAEIIQAQPTHFDARLLLSGIALKAGDPSRTVALLAGAIDKEPDLSKVYLACCNLGIALASLGRLSEAVAKFDRAIGIDPRNPGAHLGRGNALRRLGRAAAALASYDLAIASSADYAPAHCNRGVVLAEIGRAEEALISFNRAIESRRDYAEAYWNRGIVLHAQKNSDAALESCNQAIEIDPTSAQAHYNRAIILLETGRPALALSSYDRAIALAGSFAQAFCGRATAFTELNQFEQALTDYDRAIAIEPGLAAAYSNRGNTLLRMGQLEEALASYDRAIAIDPDFNMALYNRAHARLLGGNFAGGWADYEARWRYGDALLVRESRRFRRPSWLGEQPLAGKTILLHSEQGLGDTLQFCRYASIIAEKGAQVILEAPAPLIELLRSLAGVAQLVEDGQDLPDFDYHCPLMSLPLALKTTMSTIPARVPYLRVSPEKVLRWQVRLGEKKKLRVGIVWSGGFRPDQPKLWTVNHRRNVPLSKLAKLRHPDVDFYSLQKGQPAESDLGELRAAHWNGPELLDFTRLLNDFSETAALIVNLDLIISVDTSIAHLAGALGKPVWIMNRFDTCWRWLLHRSDSPWYPTVTLYRQPQPDDWDSVIRAIRADLDVAAARA